MKISIRFFENIMVRAIWHDNTSSWWYCAMDVAEALTKSKNPRIYWSTIKRRNPELIANCMQLKIMAKDGKQYLTDVVDDNGIKKIIGIISNKKTDIFYKWLKNLETSLDEKSRKKAYELYESEIINNIEVGTTKGLQQIHAFIFGGLYEFAGKIRDKNISKGGFSFAPAIFLNNTLNAIDKMPENTIETIIKKYIEMNVAHPFMEGNGRATRIWLDQMLVKNISKCVDWSLIDKQEYLNAMQESVYDSAKITILIQNALTEHFTDREIIMKGIDYSYYYEEADR